MARLIYAKDSTSMHLRMGRRHIRLCGRVPGGAPFAAAMKSPVDRLAAKERERIAADEAREEAYDVTILCDYNINNTIRDVFGKTKLYDRENLTQVTEFLFPTNGFSHIIQIPVYKKPQEAAKLLEKMERLEEGGDDLKKMCTLLQQRITDCNEAWDAFQQAITHLGIVQASEEHERLAVRQQYEHNMLDARKKYGVDMANSLFPKIGNKRIKDDSADILPPALKNE